jgi:hypothetical protein
MRRRHTIRTSILCLINYQFINQFINQLFEWQVKKALLFGGAKFLNYLSDNVTHLIADNGEHPSVSEAQEIYEKPVVTVWQHFSIYIFSFISLCINSFQILITLESMGLALSQSLNTSSVRIFIFINKAIDWLIYNYFDNKCQNPWIFSIQKPALLKHNRLSVKHIRSWCAVVVGNDHILWRIVSIATRVQLHSFDINKTWRTQIRKSDWNEWENQNCDTRLGHRFS